MLVKSYGSTIIGVNALIIIIEVDIVQGANVHIVGLPDSAVKESLQRMEAALANSKFKFPRQRIIVNLAPADIRKEGSGYDLPIAVAILMSSGQMLADDLEQYVIMGELSLDGSIKPIKGALPMAIEAKKSGYKGFILPIDNAPEAAIVSGLDVIGVNNIGEVVQFFIDHSSITPMLVDPAAEFY